MKWTALPAQLLACETSWGGFKSGTDGERVQDSKLCHFGMWIIELKAIKTQQIEEKF